MAAGEDDKKKEQGKGFAGLSSLVSDMDTTAPPAAKKPATNATGTTSGAAPQATPTKPQPAPQQPYKPPQQPGSSSSEGKWVWGIIIGIGALWLIGQSNKNTSSPAPAYSSPARSTTPSYSAPPQQPKTPPQRPKAPSRPATSTDSDLMSGGDGATYRVPSFRMAELEDSKRVAKAAQLDARNLDAQVDRQKILLNNEKSQVDEAERQLDALESEIEQQRPLVDSSNQYEIDSFNSKIREYNTNKTQLQYRIKNFNSHVNTYNDLVQRARVQEQRANDMVDTYNSKLEQYGTRQ